MKTGLLALLFAKLRITTKICRIQTSTSNKEKRAMKKRVVLVVAAFVLSMLWTLNSSAQDAGAKPKVVSEQQAVLDSWNDIGRKLIAMAEDFPEDKYEFKPNPSQRTFAEQLLHASGVNYYFTNVVKGEKPPAEENPKRELFKSKADIVAYVKKAFADGAEAIKAKGEKGMGDRITDPYSHNSVRVADYAYGFIEHDGEHYGQLVVYYRVAGLVPPESRPKK
jgi:uncharacterized damage-inducible protein DinB